jgi:hypothetical protein
MSPVVLRIRSVILAKCENRKKKKPENLPALVYIVL